MQNNRPLQKRKKSIDISFLNQFIEGDGAWKVGLERRTGFKLAQCD